MIPRPLDHTHVGHAGIHTSDPRHGLGVVGVRGFEPPTSATRTQRSTKLSHTPKRASTLEGERVGRLRPPHATVKGEESPYSYQQSGLNTPNVGLTT